MQPLKPLAQQVMVITGASSGIGRATALAAAQRGATVVLAARGLPALESLAAEIEGAGGRALAVPTDVAQAAQVEALAQRAVDVYGRIDTWVNGAAVSSYGRFEQVSPAEMSRVLEINFFGQVHGCRAALPHLKAQDRGALICIGSALSDRAVPLQSAYCASKHAVKALTETLRVELRHEGSGVQVTLIKPSSFDTPLFEHAVTHMGVKPKPIAPVYDPAIAAEAILYAAEHRVRDVAAGGGAKVLATLEAVAGPVLDWWMARTSFAGQQTQEPKGAHDANNLCASLAEPGRIRGGFGGRRWSLYTAARRRPRLTLASCAAVALMAAARVRRPS